MRVWSSTTAQSGSDLSAEPETGNTDLDRYVNRITNTVYLVYCLYLYINVSFTGLCAARSSTMVQHNVNGGDSHIKKRNVFQCFSQWLHYRTVYLSCACVETLFDGFISSVSGRTSLQSTRVNTK